MSTTTIVATPRRLIHRFAEGFRYYTGGATPEKPPAPPWMQQLSVVERCAKKALAEIGRPTQQNSQVFRYLLLDLLDVLSTHNTSSKSPFNEYAEYTGSFDDHARLAWDDLGKALFSKNRTIWRGLKIWARRVYCEQELEPTEKELVMGMFIWDSQPQLVIGPSPTTWDMALPRLMAVLFNEKMWHASKNIADQHLLNELVRNACISDLVPNVAMDVCWRRLRQHGYMYISHAMERKSDGAEPLVVDYTLLAARFAWMQTILYYVLVQGKLARVGMENCTASQRELKQELTALILLFM